MKKISIIVPIYNASKYLEKCLASLIKQTYNDLEIILIDDGSTDSSLEICKKYKNRYENIVLISQKNKGQGNARNRGIEIAKGYYITFVDSDDWVDKEMIQKLYEKSENGVKDVVIGDIIKVINNKQIYFENYNQVSTNSISNLIISHSGPVCKLIKNSVFKKNDLRFLEDKIYEDLALMPTIAFFINEIAYVKEGLYYYRIRKDSTMKSNKKLDDIFDVVNHLEKKFKIFDKKKQYEKELEYIFIEHLLYSSSLRFLNLPEYDKKIENIINIIKNKYPDWNKNKIYIKKNIKFKIVVNLIYNKKYGLLKLIEKMRK